MAIKVEDALQQIKTNIKPQVEALEEKIDAAILKSEGSFPITIGVRGVGSRKVIDECMSNYRVSGWNVKYNSDQRDGDYISIQPREKETSVDMRETNSGYWERYR